MKLNRIFAFTSLTILYSMEFINYRENYINDVLQRKKENEQSCFFVTYLTCNQLLQCKGDRFVYWLIQRDDEHNNRTIDLLYSTVYLWVVMCYVEIIKRQTSSFIPYLHLSFILQSFFSFFSWKWKNPLKKNSIKIKAIILYNLSSEKALNTAIINIHCILSVYWGIITLFWVDSRSLVAH